jgi:hypothetical protein
MEKNNLKDLTNDELEKKEKSLKSILGILTVPTVLLLFFLIRDSLNGEEIEMSLMIIAICSIGGGMSIYPQIKAVQQEMSRRVGP